MKEDGEAIANSEQVSDSLQDSEYQYQLQALTDSYQSQDSAEPPQESQQDTLPQPEQPSHSWYSVLVRPLSPIVLYIGLAVLIIILCGIFVIGSDWADGFFNDGIIACTAAFLIGIAIVIRLRIRRVALVDGLRSTRYVSIIIVVVVLFAFGGSGLIFRSQMHYLQAHTFEGNKQWTRALNEYQLAGDRLATSVDLARTNIEWGEELSSKHEYDTAIDKFNLVITGYTTNDAILTRAQTDIVNTYTLWGKILDAQRQYGQSTQLYDNALKVMSCDAQCQDDIKKLDAAAYYHLAQDEIVGRKFDDAMVTLNKITTLFPNTPEAKLVHNTYAQALLGSGQLIVSSASCSNAVSIYQQLAKDFADTDSGKQATQSLQAPQLVNGIIQQTDAPWVVTTVILYTNAVVTGTSIFDGSEVARTSVSTNGAFQFSPINLGTYDLGWVKHNSDTGAEKESMLFITSENKPVYEVKVTPLCPVNMWNVSASSSPSNLPTPVPTLSDLR